MPFVLNRPLPVNFDSSQRRLLAVLLTPRTAHKPLKDAEEVVMDAVTGTIKSYSRKTGEGLIALDSDEDPVHVDLKSSGGIWLKKGQRVQCARIHRREGVFASSIKVI